MKGLPSSVHKPFDKVLRFLEERENTGELLAGSRLPTAEALAAHLEISAGTVKNVYRTLAREGRVKTQVGVGSFWLGGGKAPEHRHYRIAFQIGHAPSIASGELETALRGRTGWSGAILGGFLKRKLERGLNVTMELYPQTMEALSRGGPAPDGVIDLSLVAHPTFPAQLPVIHLNPPFEWACRNFVAPDYYHCSRALGETWRAAGRRRILFVTCNSWAQSTSTLLRYSGLMTGIGEAIAETEIRIFEASGPGPESSCEAAALLDRWQPDAVYCIGDLLARGIIRLLHERGISVPDEVSVVGGCKTESGSERPMITSMAHPLETVGAGLLDAIIRRIQSGGRDVAGRYEPVPFSLGSSTTPAENELLFQHVRAAAATAGLEPLL